MGELPAPPWMARPDAVRTQFFAAIVARLWPFAAQWGTAWIQDCVPGLLEANRPSWVRSIKLSHVR